MTETTTQAAPSPWPLAVATLAALPGVAYLWNLSLPARGATDIEQERYDCRKIRLDWMWLYGADAGILPRPPKPPVAAALDPLPLPLAPTAAANQAADKELQRQQGAEILRAEDAVSVPLSPVAEMALQRLDADDEAERIAKEKLTAWTPQPQPSHSVSECADPANCPNCQPDGRPEPAVRCTAGDGCPEHEDGCPPDATTVIPVTETRTETFPAAEGSTP